MSINTTIPYAVEDYENVERLLMQYQQQAANKGNVLAMVPFPTKYQQYEWLIKKDTVTEFSAIRQHKNVFKLIAYKHGIPFLDIEQEITPITKEEYLKNKELLWFNCDSHMNIKGARVSAKLVAKFIEDIWANHDHLPDHH